ncbi:MAG: hypothetical protein U0570_02320 [Phycisphaerales bacterium]
MGSSFSLRDVVCAAGVLAALGVVSIPVFSQVRMDSMRQACVGNYRFISALTGSYINDHGEKMWALDWKAGTPNPLRPGQYFASDSEAQGTQAVLIYRRLGGISPNESPVPAGWLPQILNAHAALLDYANLPIPASFLVCPADATRQGYLDGDYSPLPGFSGDNSVGIWRWIYSSTYKPDVYLWSPSRTYRATNPQGAMQWAPMFYQTPSDANFWSFDGDLSIRDALGPKPASNVVFPSQKVFLSDDYARHGGQTRFYADQAAAQDLLFHDGSVRYYRTDATNPGWDPRTKTTRNNMTGRFAFTKQVDAFGSLFNGAKSANYTAGWYRWTRGGLNGWDVPRMSSMVGKLPSPSVVENEVDTSAATGTW